MLLTLQRAPQFPLFLSRFDQQPLPDFHAIPLQAVPLPELIRRGLEFSGDAEEGVSPFDFIVKRLGDKRGDGSAEPSLFSGVLTLLRVNRVHIIDERIKRGLLTADRREIALGDPWTRNADAVRSEEVESTGTH